MQRLSRNSILPKLHSAIVRDFTQFKAAFSSSQPNELSVRPSLYTYRYELPGSKKRVHLRVEADGSGVLFSNVKHIIYLNPTATSITKMALDGVTKEQTRALLKARYGKSIEPDISSQLDRIYTIVERFTDPNTDCPVIGIPEIQQNKPFSTPIHSLFKVDIALTYQCNNACSHCYNESGRFDMPSLQLEQWQSIIDKLTEVGVPQIIFTGGEPTLYPRLPELIKYADQNGMIVGMNTNGRRLSYLPYIEDLTKAGLNHVQITLSSHIPEIHNLVQGAYAFEQTVSGIENALTSGVHTITNTTLMSINQGHIEETIEYLHGLNIGTFAINGMIYSGGGPRNPLAIPENEMAPILVRIRDKAEELGMRFLWYTPTEYCHLSPVELEIGTKCCNAAQYSVCIEPSGDVLPCQSYYIPAGNILKDSWDKIWNSRLFRSFRERVENPSAAGLPEKCWSCPQLKLCGGGCPLERASTEEMASPVCTECGGNRISKQLSAPFGFTSGVSQGRGVGRGVPLPEEVVDRILNKENVDSLIR